MVEARKGPPPARHTRFFFFFFFLFLGLLFRFTPSLSALVLVRARAPAAGMAASMKRLGGLDLVGRRVLEQAKRGRPGRDVVPGSLATGVFLGAGGK